MAEQWEHGGAARRSHSSVVEQLRHAREAVVHARTAHVLGAAALLREPAPPSPPPPLPQPELEAATTEVAAVPSDDPVELGDVAVALGVLASEFPVAQAALPPIVLRSQLYARVGDRTLVDREVVCFGQTQNSFNTLACHHMIVQNNLHTQERLCRARKVQVCVADKTDPARDMLVPFRNYSALVLQAGHNPHFAHAAGVFRLFTTPPQPSTQSAGH